MTFIINFIVLVMTMILVIFVDVKLSDDISDGKWFSAGINIFIQLIIITILITLK